MVGRALPWPTMGKLTLSVDDFTAQMENDGRPTRVRRASMCECYDDETRRPSSSCLDCSGWGMQYLLADEVPDLMVLWANFTRSTNYQEIGLVGTGGVSVTWATQILGHGDLFVHPVEATRNNELLKRGELDPLGNSMERLLHENIVDVDPITRDGTVYVEGVDWQLNGQRIEWIGAAPAAGETYGVRYTYRAQYVIVEEAPKMREDTGELLIFTAKLARFESVSRQEGPQHGQQ